ncbi:MAG TPA: HRDC domain-containing protein [Nannocystaceae bacterium]|nr:HRDC domain-containing protein [Nannocystaceae bacterium]
MTQEHWIDDERALAELVTRASDGPAIALDTESNGMHAYHERVCLVQLSMPGHDAVIDPLAVDPAGLATLFADPRVVKVMHAADNDILALARSFALPVRGVFDTMLAARALGWPRSGLGEILAERFGHAADKRWQRHDWSRRPLPAEALAYARADTRFLLELREQQIAELAALDRLDDVLHACARLERLRPRAKVFDTEGWVKIDGARKLPPEGRAVLRALWILREEIAEQLDRAPYRVLGNDVLRELATTRPIDPREVARTRGVGGPAAHRYATTIASAIAAAIDGPEPAWPSPPPRPDRAFTQRFDALRSWRRDQANARGLEPDIILGKDAMLALAEQDPKDRDALVASGLLDEWELERYADAIVHALARGR